MRPIRGGQEAVNPSDVVQRLEEVYGRTDWVPHHEPLEELIACILSQHTSDANSIPAFERLRRELPTWDEVVEAGPERVAGIIRSAGLANSKARSIDACLREIRQRNGAYSLDLLRDMPMLQAREWLVSLPGVGPKTASIVLCFALGMESIPVDTHVFRVSWRLGLIPQAAGEAKAHDLLLALIPPDLAYRFHVALIAHGRAVCKAPLPLCDRCVIRDLCRWYGEGGPEKKRAELRRFGPKAPTP